MSLLRPLTATGSACVLHRGSTSAILWPVLLPGAPQLLNQNKVTAPAASPTKPSSLHTAEGFQHPSGSIAANVPAEGPTNWLIILTISTKTRRSGRARCTLETNNQHGRPQGSLGSRLLKIPSSKSSAGGRSGAGDLYGSHTRKCFQTGKGYNVLQNKCFLSYCKYSKKINSDSKDL